MCEIQQFKYSLHVLSPNPLYLAPPSLCLISFGCENLQDVCSAENSQHSHHQHKLQTRALSFHIHMHVSLKANIYKCISFTFHFTTDGASIKSISENVIVNPGEDAMLSCTVEGTYTYSFHVDCCSRSKCNFICVRANNSIWK